MSRLETPQLVIATMFEGMPMISPNVFYERISGSPSFEWSQIQRLLILRTAIMKRGHESGA